MTVKEQVLELLKKADRPMPAADVAKALKILEGSAQPALSTLYYDGKLDRERINGFLHFRYLAKPVPPRPRTGQKKRPQHRKPTPETLVIVKVKGIELCEKEAFEVYEALGRIFDRVTQPKS